MNFLGVISPKYVLLNIVAFKGILLKFKTLCNECNF